MAFFAQGHRHPPRSFDPRATQNRRRCPNEDRPDWDSGISWKLPFMRVLFEPSAYEGRGSRLSLAMVPTDEVLDFHENLDKAAGQVFEPTVWETEVGRRPRPELLQPARSNRQGHPCANEAAGARLKLCRCYLEQAGATDALARDVGRLQCSDYPGAEHHLAEPNQVGLHPQHAECHAGALART